MPKELLYRELYDHYETSAEFQLACIVCGAEADDMRIDTCIHCGGALDAIYGLAAGLHEFPETPNVLMRYFSLLPIRARENALWLGEGNTPCFKAEKLAAELGMTEVYLKDESRNPTMSTKDRIASVGLSRFRELGVHEFAMASTGNSSTAYARAVRLLPEFTAHIFSGRDFVSRLNYLDHPRIATYAIDGEFAMAGPAAQRFAAEQGITWEGGFFNFARREGLKLAYLEAYDAIPETPDYVFQAVSSGMGLLGGYKGALEYHRLGRLSRVPGFVAVQQATCAPMAHAYAECAESIEKRHIVKNPRGLAEAILRGNPAPSFPYIRSLCSATDGDIIAAPDEDILTARRLLADLEGVRVCFASATALAGLIVARRDRAVRDDATVLINLTGGDRPRTPVPQKITAYRHETTG